MAEQKVKFVAEISLYACPVGTTLDEFGSYVKQLIADMRNSLDRDHHVEEFMSTLVIDHEDKPAAVRALYAKLQQCVNLPEDVFDDMVHDCASETGSRVNNQGWESQLEYLVAELGAKQATSDVEDAIRDYVPATGARTSEQAYDMHNLGVRHTLADPDCEGCCGRGWLVVSLFSSQFCPDGTVAVAKCDACDVLNCDDQAVPLAREAGLKINSLYPFWIEDSPHNVALFAKEGTPDGSLQWKAIVKGIPREDRTTDS